MIRSVERSVWPPMAREKLEKGRDLRITFFRYLIRSCSFDFAFFRLSRRIINGKVDRSAPDV